MAITIYQTPQEYSPAYNDLNFTANSSITDVTYTNLVRILYPSSVDINLKYRPRPDHLMYSDVHSIVEGYLSHDFEFEVAADTTFTRCPKSWVKYKCDIAENGSSTSGSNKYAFNALLNYDEFIDYNQSEYLFSSGDTGTKFLTNSPRNVEIRLDQRYYLGIMTRLYPSFETAVQVEINTYDVNGTLIDSIARVNPYTSIANDGNRFLNILVGAEDINKAIAPLDPVITSDVAYYTIQVVGTTGYTSELFTFTLNHKCTEYQVFQLFFLNRLGRFDAFSFTQAHQKLNSYQKSNYKQYTGQMVNNQWTRYPWDTANTQFNTLNTVSMVLNSDWITEEQSAWLEELVSSPVVYIWDGNTFLSVDIPETSYEEKYYNNSQLFNLQLTVQHSIQNQRQRG